MQNRESKIEANKTAQVRGTALVGMELLQTISTIPKASAGRNSFTTAAPIGARDCYGAIEVLLKTQMILIAS